MKPAHLRAWMVAAAFFVFAGVAVLGLAFVRNAIEDLPSVEGLKQYVPPLVHAGARHSTPAADRRILSPKA